MVKYKGSLKSKDEELSCECEGHDIERKLSEYQKYIQNCMQGFSPRGRSAAENQTLMRERFRQCAESFRGYMGRTAPTSR